MLEDLFSTEIMPAWREPARPEIIALIPVHNELEFGATISAVLGQSCPPDRIYVLTDNCRDQRIWDIAAAFADRGVSVSCTTGNKHKKAGNLNSALAALLPSLPDDAIVAGFDADSIPDREFIANAMTWIGAGYGAVGATFSGRRGGGVLGMLQRCEFARFARHQHRHSKTDVLSGTGWVIPAAVLRMVAAGRKDGMVYHTHHITEDFELTVAIRTAGERAVSPADCRVTTDVMTTVKDWITQRLRWQVGTLAVLASYGWHRETRMMIARQVMIYLVMIATPMVAVYLTWSFLLFGLRGIDPLNAPLYAAGIGVVVIEQAWQSRKAGPWAVIVTLLVIPDLLYSFARQGIYLRAAWRLLRGKTVAWGAGASL
jgi:poly-beta-1,6-N-acetyl-D-glucosamine synthase